MTLRTLVGAAGWLLMLSSLIGPAAAAPASAPGETRLYLRYDDRAATQCGGRYLSLIDGPDGAGEDCQSQTAITTLAGQTSTQAWVADERAAWSVPVDAARKVTGEFTVETASSGAHQPLPNWVEMDVVVTLNNTVLPAARLSSGPYTGPQKTLTFSIDIPDSLDQVQVTAARVAVTWRRVVHAPGAYHTSISMDGPASFVTIP